MKHFFIISDPAVNDYGPTRPPILISKKLVENDFEVTFISPIISGKIKNFLEKNRIGSVSMGIPEMIGDSSKRLFLLWIFENMFNYINYKLRKTIDKELFKNSYILNFSNIFQIFSHIWYAQGPFAFAFKDIDWYSWGTKYYLLAKVSYPFVKFLDYRHLKKMYNATSIIVANSRFTARMYKDMGIDVNAVVYPPIDTNVFKPSTTNPTGDYVLTYVGKETDFKALLGLARHGIYIKAFGGKEKIIPRELLKFDNFHFYGAVSTKKLIDLYSNALFTVFPFTHEPFGYIPIESLSCGTPVLTYNKQGPREVITNNKTGWLVSNRKEMIEKAIKIWRSGYDDSMRYYSIERAKNYDADVIYEKWIKVIDKMLYVSKLNNKYRRISMVEILKNTIRKNILQHV